jgi:hypothetical protein
MFSLEKMSLHNLCLFLNWVSLLLSSKRYLYICILDPYKICDLQIFFPILWVIFCDLSHISSLFCSGYFGDGVSGTICLVLNHDPPDLSL